MFIFIIIELLLHMTEEFLGGFPNWATKYFGTTTYEWYALSHVILYPLIIYFCLKAQWSKNNSIWIFIATGIQTVIFTNALFHVSMVLLSQEYSPGIYSALIVTLPFSAYFYYAVFKKKLLDKKKLIQSITGGALVSILIILSLLVHL